MQDVCRRGPVGHEELPGASNGHRGRNFCCTSAVTFWLAWARSRSTTRVKPGRERSAQSEIQSRCGLRRESVATGSRCRSRREAAASPGFPFGDRATCWLLVGRLLPAGLVATAAGRSDRSGLSICERIARLVQAVGVNVSIEAVCPGSETVEYDGDETLGAF
jgi:hypothetical protein